MIREACRIGLVLPVVVVAVLGQAPPVGQRS